MKLDREQIIKALECCTSPDRGMICIDNGCPYGDVNLCEQLLMAHSLALIKEQEQKISELEKRLKECENGYESTLHLERAKIKKLTEERDTYRTAAYNLQKYVGYIKHKEEEGYEPSAARYAAEMEMWHRIALREKELVEDNERLRSELEQRPPKLIITKKPKRKDN